MMADPIFIVSFGVQQIKGFSKALTFIKETHDDIPNKIIQRVDVILQDFLFIFKFFKSVADILILIFDSILDFDEGVSLLVIMITMLLIIVIDVIHLLVHISNFLINSFLFKVNFFLFFIL